MFDFLVVAFFGRLLLYLIQKFPLPQFLEKRKFFRNLHECDLCLGVYVYTLLAWAYGFSILLELGFIYIPVLDEVLSGMFLSFSVHLVRIGWQEKFGQTEIILE